MRAHPGSSSTLGFLGGVGSPLVLGGMIYLLWRPDTLRMFDWAEAIGGAAALESWRQTAAASQLPAWLLYSFPDGAWAFTGTAVLCRIWSSGRRAQRLVWTSLIPALAIGSEVGQYLGWVSGQYDTADLATVVIACFCGFYLQLNRILPDTLHETQPA